MTNTGGALELRPSPQRAGIEILPWEVCSLAASFRKQSSIAPVNRAPKQNFLCKQKKIWFNREIETKEPKLSHNVELPLLPIRKINDGQ